MNQEQAVEYRLQLIESLKALVPAGASTGLIHFDTAYCPLLDEQNDFKVKYANVYDQVNCPACVNAYYVLERQVLPRTTKKRGIPLFSFGVPFGAQVDGSRSKNYTSLLKYGFDVGRSHLTAKDVKDVMNYVPESYTYLMALRMDWEATPSLNERGDRMSKDILRNVLMHKEISQNIENGTSSQFLTNYNETVLRRLYAGYLAAHQVCNILKLHPPQKMPKKLKYGQFTAGLAKINVTGLPSAGFQTHFQADPQDLISFVVHDGIVQMSITLNQGKIPNLAILSLIRKVAKMYLETDFKLKGKEDIVDRYLSHIDHKSWAFVRGFLELSYYGLDKVLSPEDIAKYHSMIFESSRAYDKYKKECKKTGETPLKSAEFYTERNIYTVREIKGIIRNLAQDMKLEPITKQVRGYWSQEHRALEGLAANIREFTRKEKAAIIKHERYIQKQHRFVRHTIMKSKE